MARRRNQGSKWIRKTTRLAIYHRDGHRCVYCGATDADGARLTLDHIVACELTETPDNSPANLVTCCLACNSAKQHLTLRGWLRYLRDVKGWTKSETTAAARRVRRLASKAIDRAAGRRLAQRSAA
jgi:5-methylcytosine-specific restriction endonuclease McrA